MFMGEYEHTIDAKGRLIVPAKFREQLGAGFVVTMGVDNCLFIYTAEEWEDISKKLAALPITNPDARRFVRITQSKACNCEYDKQGRILIPQILRSFANLTKDVVLAGIGNRIEIWDKEAWIKATAYDDLDEIVSAMANLGI